MLTSGVLLTDVHFPSAGEDFPFDLPLLERTRSVALDQPVTVLVGENGSGKSTLLEAIALASELPVVGSVQTSDLDPSFDAVRPLADALRLAWTRRTRQGLFLRAEDYFGFVKNQNRMKAEMRQQLARLQRENPGISNLELRRISTPYAGSLSATEARYGSDLDALSHGESFLALFKGRLTGPGLYVLDEPEAALSPLRQLAFMALMKEAVVRGAQFLVATHSPILMAFEGARLYEIRDHEIVAAEYDDLEHVRTMRNFLEGPEAFLRHL